MSGAHLGDALSALLDGELGPADESAARAHLDGCPACTAELSATARTRALLRGLPEVEAPFGLFERLLARSRRPTRAYAALAGAAAAAIAVVLMADPGTDPVDPRVADLVERHAATASAGGDPVTQFVPAGVRVGP